MLWHEYPPRLASDLQLREYHLARHYNDGGYYYSSLTPDQAKGRTMAAPQPEG